MLWILIILLALGVVLLICPLNYSLKANGMPPKAKASVSYLFHIIYATVSYNNKLEIKLRLFGIPINISKLQSKNETPKDNKEDDKTQSELNLTDQNTDEKKKVTSKSGKKIDLRAGYDVLMKDNTRAAFLVVKKRMGKLFRAILPYKFKLKMTYGLNNPAYTGFVLGLYEMLIFYLGRSIELNPVFDDTAFEFDLKLKGRIIPIVMLVQLIAVVLNKNCRRFISDIRRSV